MPAAITVPNITQCYRNSAFRKQDGHCYYCSTLMWDENIYQFSIRFNVTLSHSKLYKSTGEHLIAKQDSGLNTQSNIVAACLFCNQTRHKSRKPLTSDKFRTHVLGRLRKGKWNKPIFDALGIRES